MEIIIELNAWSVEAKEKIRNWVEFFAELKKEYPDTMASIRARID